MSHISRIAPHVAGSCYGDLMNIAAGDIPESNRRPSSVTSQRADELSDEQPMTRLSGQGAEVAISELYPRY